MDIYNEDIINFWRRLRDNNVKYILIGGFAINFHGYQRFTGDIDIWIEDNKENRSNLGKVMTELGYSEVNWDDFIFIPGWTDFSLFNGIKVDILTSMLGLESLDFNQCLQEASVAEIDDLKIPFLHINHLILNKKVTNRPKDRLDVEELEKIKKIIG